MCSSPDIPAAPPPPPPPPRAPKQVDERAKAVRGSDRKKKLAAAGRQGTILTSALGVQGEANTGRKTLLGV